MPEAPPVPEVPVPADPAAPGNLFANYNPEGAMGGLFAPAYIRGFAPSEKAVADFAARRLPASMVDQTRMPNPWMGSPPNILADGVYGSGVPSYQSYADARGQVDPNALRAAAQGTPYDLAARREAISQRLLANATAQGHYPELAGISGEVPKNWQSTSDLEFPEYLKKWIYAQSTAHD